MTEREWKMENISKTRNEDIYKIRNKISVTVVVAWMAKIRVYVITVQSS